MHRLCSDPFRDFSVVQRKLSNTDPRLRIDLLIRRSFGVRTIAIVIVVINCVYFPLAVSSSSVFILLSGFITAIVLWITMAALMFPETFINELVAIPTVSVFAVLSVRANMPGIPAGFGKPLLNPLPPTPHLFFRHATLSIVDIPPISTGTIIG